MILLLLFDAVSGMAKEMQQMFQKHCLDHVAGQLRVNFCSGIYILYILSHHVTSDMCLCALVWEEASPEALAARTAMRSRLKYLSV